MPRALVTGATGFIGRHLVEALVARDYEVFCLARSSSVSKLAAANCRAIAGDVVNAQSVKEAVNASRPDLILHLAGLTKAIRSQELYSVNRDGTRNVFAAAVANGSDSAPTVLLVSSLSAAGPARDSKPKVETDDPAPVSIYGKSKLAAERCAIDYCDRVPVTIVRPPIVFGPYDLATLEMFKTVAGWGVHPLPLRTSTDVSWIHVADLVNAIITAAQSGTRVSSKPGDGIYFTTSGETADYGRIGPIIGDALGRRRVRIIKNPKSGTWLLAGLNELISRMRGEAHIFGLDKAREATAGSWICDGRKLRNDVGFNCKFSLEETLCSTAQWYRRAGWI